MSTSEPAWRFHHFGLLVTGEGEAAFLPQLLRALQSTGRCHVEVIRKIEQRHPITSPVKLAVIGTRKGIPSRDFDEIVPHARGFLNRHQSEARRAFVLLIDDMEHARVEQAHAVFRRYRDVLDKGLLERKHLASVHFLVNMMEAYYFADAKALNEVLGTQLADHAEDVEEIRHPKNDLKKMRLPRGRPFDEVEDGRKIVTVLDVAHVLARPDTCASLRTLFAWCFKAMGEEPTEQFCLTSGVHSVVTGPQLGALP